TPHHLHLTDSACAHYDTNTKVAPPLRTARDVGALKQAVADGTVDAIATDHAPHSPVEKELEFDLAAFGLVGLETALPLVLALVRDGARPLARAVSLLTDGPARCFGLDAGRLAEGGVADLAVIDPDKTWIVSAETLRSKSKNSPFLGREMRGAAVYTFVGGKLIHGELPWNDRRSSRSRTERSTAASPTVPRGRPSARSCSTRRSPATRRSSPTRRTPDRSSS